MSHRRAKTIPAFFLLLLLIALGSLVYLLFQSPNSNNHSPHFARGSPASDWQYETKNAGVLTTSIKQDTKVGSQLRIATADTSLNLTLPFADGAISQPSPNSILLASANQTMTTTYEVEPNRLKEAITIKKPPTNPESSKEVAFTLPLTTTNLDIYLTADNLPVFFNSQTHDYQFHIERPFAIDAKGNKTYALRYYLRASSAPDKAITYPKLKSKIDQLAKLFKVGSSNEKYTLTLAIDNSWLQDPARAYPVTIDPTVTHDTQSEFTTGTLNRLKDTGAGDATPNLETYYQELGSDPYAVGLWHMDEAADNSCSGGQDACDSSGLGNHGTATGTTIINGILGKARSFNGSSEYISAGTPASLNNLPSTSNFTISSWIYDTETDNTTWGTIFGTYITGVGWSLRTYSDGSGNRSLYLEVPFSTTTAVYQTAYGSIPRNAWTHIAVVWNYSTKVAQIYINGIEVSYTTSTPGSGTYSSDASNNKEVGRLPHSSGIQHFQGNIDDLLIINRLLNPEQIKAAASRRPSSIFTSPIIDTTYESIWDQISWTPVGIGTGDGETASNSASLVAQWNFNETSGTNAASGGSCGSTCNGTLAAGFASTASQDQAAGTGWTAANKRWGAGALMFDGTNDVLTCADNVCGGTDNMDIGDRNWSVGTWIKTNATSRQIIIAKGDSTGQYSWQLDISSPTIGATGAPTFIFYNTADGAYMNTPITKTINDGNWHNTVGTYDGTTIKIYIDGALAGSSTSKTGTQVTNSTGQLSIGARGGASLVMGVLDNISIYSRALSASEILSNYNAGSISFQTRSSSDGTTWEAWKPTTTETQLDSWDTRSTAWQIDTNQSASSTITSNAGINTGTGNDGDCIINNGTKVLDTDNGSDVCNSSVRATPYAVNFTSTVLTKTGDSSITVSATPTGLAAGDEVLIINLQGTSTNYDSTGLYETHIIDSIATNTLNFTDFPIRHTYDGTTQKIVVQRVPQFEDVVICGGNTGSGCSAAATLTSSAWNGTKGGVLHFRATGTITADSGSTMSVSAKGYAGGVGEVSLDGNYRSYKGESYCGASTNGGAYNSAPANCGGGGGGFSWRDYNPAGAGGGAHGSIGAAGSNSGSPVSTGGSAGTGYSEASLNRMFFGSGGGAGGRSANYGGGAGCNGTAGSGGVGGGILFMAANSIVNNGSIIANGSNGTDYSQESPCQWGGSGGGAGGTINLKANTVTLGSSLINATAGNAGAKYGGSAGAGGAGSVGRIMAEYTSTLSGTTNPALSATKIASQLKVEGSSAFQLTQGKSLTDSTTVGLWHLDETGGTGAYLKDASGNANHGTPTGTTLVEGITGKARNLNGSSDYIEITSPDLPTADFTYSAWIYPDTTNDEKIFMAADGSGNNEILIGLESTNKLAVYTNNSLRATSSTSISSGKWTHISVTRSGSTIYLYINGVLDANTGSDSGALNFSTCSLLIGADVDSACTGTLGNWFDGIIDEAVIYSTALTYEQIAESYRLGRDHRLSGTISSTDLSTDSKLPFYIASDRKGTFMELTAGESAFANYEPDANTVGLWHLEEKSGSGAYLKDSSGYSNHGTPTSSTFVQGKIGKAYYFSGSGYITMTEDLAAYNPGNYQTISAWVNHFTINSTERRIYENYGLNQDNLVMIAATTSNKFQAFYRDGSANAAAPTSLTTPVVNTWYHVVAVKNGTTVSLYVNGTLEATSTNPSLGTITLSDSWYPTIGRSRAWNNAYVHGLIDEVRIDNIARTADEIRQAYEVGRRTHPITIDFKAALDSGNLIADSNDLAFTVDETIYGSSAKANHLYVGDKIIIKENYDGTEYLSQGEVSGVTSSTGAVTVSTWDSGSTFPTSGFTASATVFKWQREFMDLSGSLASHRNAITRLTYRITDGSLGANVWLDDLRKTASYLSTPTGSTITSTVNRYFQYRTLLTSSDPFVSPSFNTVSLSYAPSVSDLTSCESNLDYITPDIDLSWADINTTESGYEVERSVDGGAFAPLTTTAANTLVYSDATIQGNHTYSYRIRAYLEATPENFTTNWCTTDTINYTVGTFSIGSGTMMNGIKIY